MGGVGKHLQQRHDQQNPTVIAARSARCRDNRAQIETGAGDQKHKGHAENHQKHQHLQHVRAQRRRQATPSGIDKAHKCDDQNRRRATARQYGVENKPDNQQVGEYFGQEAQRDHQIVAAISRDPETRAKPVLNRHRPVFTQAAHDKATCQKGPVISGIGQGARDAVVVSQNRRVHQRTGENPCGDLA